MNLKEKIERFKSVLKDFDKLEKSVQVQLMNVADKMAPKVAGGNIAPKEMQVPEPVEYPDIKEQVVSTSKVQKHAFDTFAATLAKDEWHPSFYKTQKHPSTTVPYEEKPGNPDYIKAPENVDAHQRQLRDDTKKHQLEKFADQFAKANWKPGFSKAEEMGERPQMAPVKMPSANPKEIQPPRK